MIEDGVEDPYQRQHAEDELDSLGLPVAPEPKFLEIRELINRVAAADMIEKQVRKLKADEGAEISKLDRNLRPEVFAEREREIRARFQNDIDAEFKKAGALIDAGASAAPLWTREQALARSRFDADANKDATQRAAWITRLSRATEPRLIEFSRRAALENNLALASAIYEEVDARGDDLDRKTRAQVKVILNRIPSDADKAAPLLRLLDQLGGRLRLAAGATGFQRISVGLASGERRDYEPPEDDDALPLNGGAVRIAKGLRERAEAPKE